jgi:hypothetical protein
MGDRQVTPKDLAQIVQAVRELGLAGIGDRSLPEPSDHPAESSVLAALLGGLVALEHLPSLVAEHFNHPLHRDLFALVAGGVHPQNWAVLADDLSAQGYPGDLGAWLSCLEASATFCGLAAVQADAHRVRELYRRRRLVRFLEGLAVKLRADTTTADDVLEELHLASEPKTNRRRAA